MDQGCGRNNPTPVRDQAMRTQLGRPRSIMRLRAWVATATSVADARPCASAPVADHLLPPRDGGLGPGSLRVPGRLLPAHPAVRRDELEMTVALRRFGLGHLVGTAIARGATMTAAVGWRSCDAVVDAILIVPTVAGERGPACPLPGRARDRPGRRRPPGRPADPCNTSQTAPRLEWTGLAQRCGERATRPAHWHLYLAEPATSLPAFDIGRQR